MSLTYKLKYRIWNGQRVDNETGWRTREVGRGQRDSVTFSFFAALSHRSSINPRSNAMLCIFPLEGTFRVVGSNDKIKRHCRSSDDLSDKVNWPAAPRVFDALFFLSPLFIRRSSFHRWLPILLFVPRCWSFVRRVASRSFPPRFGRYRNWFIGGQSMNNSNRTIHSPINLGPKAAWQPIV